MLATALRITKGGDTVLFAVLVSSICAACRKPFGTSHRGSFFCELLNSRHRPGHGVRVSQVEVCTPLGRTCDESSCPRIRCPGYLLNTSSRRCFSSIRFRRLDADGGWLNTKTLDLLSFFSILRHLNSSRKSKQSKEMLQD